MFFQALMTEELRQLFSLKVDPAVVAASATRSSSGRSPRDIMNSYASRSEEDLLVADGASSGGGAVGNAAGSAGPVDAKSRLLLVLTLFHLSQ